MEKTIVILKLFAFVGTIVAMFCSFSGDIAMAALGWNVTAVFLWFAIIFEDMRKKREKRMKEE